MLSSQALPTPPKKLRPVYDEVLLFCPDAVTGGPEAIHQLAHAINQQGGNAKMAYYGPISRLEMKGNQFCNDTAASPLPQAYAQYQPQVLKETRLTSGTLIVYPEVLVFSSSHHCAMWWLSVDNALQANPSLRDKEFRDQFFADKNLIHLYQSEYAESYLRECGASNIHPLTDYTDPQFIEHSLNSPDNKPITERGNRLCFFPAKGAELARDFLTHGGLRHQIDLIPIRKMTKTEVRDTLFKAKIYIDFGHHPGKDRVPREAAIAGAIVLLHAAGAANCYGDHPLSDAYRFTREDITAGRLHERIDAILDDPQTHFDAQRTYREKILQEKQCFEAEVRSFFFKQD